METAGPTVGEQRERMGWYSLCVYGRGAGREGIREAQGGFSYVCVCGVCSVGAGLEMGVWVLWQRPQWASLGSHMKRHGKRSHAYDLAPRACQTLQTLQRRLGTPAVQ